MVTSGLSQCQHLIAKKWKSPATSPTILCLGLILLALHCRTGEMLMIYSSVSQSGHLAFRNLAALEEKA